MTTSISSTRIARDAIKAWPRHALATRQQTNHLRRGYIRARRILGDRWLLANPVPRKQAGHSTVDLAVFLLVVWLFSIGVAGGWVL